ncbi:uncharacterized protein LOC135203210 [Macrobrachium nipponense]|uniref:uncharacterized protein LOC135203210 n=1 Tax=Macrobrachium nipponense TaxID=159736 RepID=UPI0030C7A18C
MVFTAKKGAPPIVEIKGTATLCFNEEGTRFQGSISAEDDTQFVIYGKKSQLSEDAENETTEDQLGINPGDEQDTVPVTFDIRIVDCEVGEEYSLEKVHGRNGELCTFSCASVSFTTEEVYRGHKADMVSQNCLGHTMNGKRTTVYRGPIKLSYEAAPRNVQWVL